MNQGDYVLVEQGMMHAVGRVNCGAGVLVPMRPGFVCLDVCSMGVHLPQYYRPAECTPLAEVDLASHGLCGFCRGWGLTSMFDYAESIDEVIDGNAGDKCGACGGSGRRGITVTVERNEHGGIEGRVDLAPDAAAAVTCESCAQMYVTEGSAGWL